MRRLALAVPLLALAIAPSARAAEVVIGSDLQPDATISANDGNDWAAWNTSLASGGLVQSPVQGEVNVVNLKGRMNLEGRAQLPPDVVMHVMVLRPQGDGTVASPAGGVSEDLPLPFGGDPNQVNTYDRSSLTKPDAANGKGGTRLCIQTGDYLAFTTSGGFGGYAQDNPEQIYVDGAEFQVFGAARSSSDYFERGGAFDGSPFRASPFNGRELLMNATIGTRENARYTCRTAAEQRENLDTTPVVAAPTASPGLDPLPIAAPAPIGRAGLVKPRRAPTVTGRKVRLALKCTTAGACSGTVALRTYAPARAFTLAAGRTGRVTLVLKKKARRKLRRRGARLTVKAMLVSADGYRQSLRFKVKRA